MAPSPRILVGRESRCCTRGMSRPSSSTRGRRPRRVHHPRRVTASVSLLRLLLSPPLAVLAMLGLGCLVSSTLAFHPTAFAAGAEAARRAGDRHRSVVTLAPSPSRLAAGRQTLMLRSSGRRSGTADGLRSTTPPGGDDFDDDGDGESLLVAPPHEEGRTEPMQQRPPSSSSKSEDPPEARTQGQEQQPQHELLQELDSAFRYDGRLPSKQAASPQKSDDDGGTFRCGFVSILGAPNMGKSTLLNALLQEDLCITTRRPQTTRHAILGVLGTSRSQCCLVDTPGIIDEPSYRLQEGMMDAVRGAFSDADAMLVVTDLYSTPIPDDTLFQRVVARSAHQPVLVAVNKVDLAGRAATTTGTSSRTTQKPPPPSPPGTGTDWDASQERSKKTLTVPDAVAMWRSLLPNALAIVPLSAAGGADDVGVALLRQLLVGGDDVPASIRALGRPVPGMFRDGVQMLTNGDARAVLPVGPPLYDEGLLTDRTERFFCAELVREALFETFDKEVPYCCEVQVTDFTEPKFKGQPCNIQATVFVERESQKPIVVGRGGEQIKQVGTLARRKIEKFLGYDTDGDRTKVFLQLTVKVNKDWRKREDRLVEFGYLKQKK